MEAGGLDVTRLACSAGAHRGWLPVGVGATGQEAGAAAGAHGAGCSEIKGWLELVATIDRPTHEPHACEERSHSTDRSQCRAD